MEASNTGTAFIETTGTLTAVPEVSTTLSEARFPGDVAAIVPLPPTLVLMLGGLAALGVGGLQRG